MADMKIVVEETMKGTGPEKIIDGLRTASEHAGKLNQLLGKDLIQNLDAVLSKLNSLSTTLASVGKTFGQVSGTTQAATGRGTSMGEAAASGRYNAEQVIDRTMGRSAAGAAGAPPTPPSGGAPAGLPPGGYPVDFSRLMQAFATGGTASMISAVGGGVGFLGGATLAMRAMSAPIEFGTYMPARAMAAQRRMETQTADAALRGDIGLGMMEQMGVGAAAEFNRSSYAQFVMGAKGGFSNLLSYATGGHWKSLAELEAEELAKRRGLAKDQYAYFDETTRRQMELSSRFRGMESVYGSDATTTLVQAMRGRRISVDETEGFATAATGAGLITRSISEEDFKKQPSIQAYIKGMEDKRSGLTPKTSDNSMLSKAKDLLDQAFLGSSDVNERLKLFLEIKEARELREKRAKANEDKARGFADLMESTRTYGASESYISQSIRRAQYGMGPTTGQGIVTGLQNFLSNAGLGGAETGIARQMATGTAANVMAATPMEAQGFAMGGVAGRISAGTNLAAQNYGIDMSTEAGRVRATTIGAETGAAGTDYMRRLMSSPLSLPSIGLKAKLAQLGLVKMIPIVEKMVATAVSYEQSPKDWDTLARPLKEAGYKGDGRSLAKEVLGSRNVPLKWAQGEHGKGFTKADVAVAKALATAQGGDPKSAVSTYAMALTVGGGSWKEGQAGLASIGEGATPPTPGAAVAPLPLTIEQKGIQMATSVEAGKFVAFAQSAERIKVSITEEGRKFGQAIAREFIKVIEEMTKAEPAAPSTYEGPGKKTPGKEQTVTQSLRGRLSR